MLWYNHSSSQMCSLIWTGFSGERCGHGPLVLYVVVICFWYSCPANPKVKTRTCDSWQKFQKRVHKIVFMYGKCPQQSESEPLPLLRHYRDPTASFSKNKKTTKIGNSYCIYVYVIALKYWYLVLGKKYRIKKFWKTWYDCKEFIKDWLFLFDNMYRRFFFLLIKFLEIELN